MAWTRIPPNPDLDEENQVDCRTLDPSKPQSYEPRGILDPQPNNLANQSVCRRTSQPKCILDWWVRFEWQETFKYSRKALLARECDKAHNICWKILIPPKRLRG